MRLLLDTHVLVWATLTPERLRTGMVTAIADPANDVFVSAASAWEIAIKATLGRLSFPIDRLEAVLVAVGVAPLPISLAHAVAAGSLPRHHDDPFDRMLVAQARLESLVLVTEDATLARYDVAIFGRESGGGGA